MTTNNGPALPVNALVRFLQFADAQDFWLISKGVIASATSRAVLAQLSHYRIDGRRAQALSESFVGDAAARGRAPVPAPEWDQRVLCDFVRYLQSQGYQLSRVGKSDSGPRLRIVLDMSWPDDRAEVAAQAETYLSDPMTLRP